MIDDRLAGLVPQPRSVQARPGRLALSAPPGVTSGAGWPQPAASAAAASAATAVRHLLGRLPWPGSPEPGSPEPGSAEPGSAEPGRADVQCTVAIDASLGAEAYRLTIGQTGIAIAAGDTAGAVYAVQTVRQLLPADAWRAAPVQETTWWLPCAEITDAPALAWRGAHLDVARHFFGKREVLTLIDALAALKLNRLHLHLTDDQGWRLESRLHPALHEVGSHRPRTRISLNDEQPPAYAEIPHGGYYTLADLAEIAAFAAQRGMQIVPEIDLPGHCAALLAAMPELGSGSPPPGGYQVLADWGIFPYLLAPLPESMTLLREVFGELVAATGARFVHIGGDECLLGAWREDPRIDASRRERRLGRAEDLHAAFLHDVADMLAEDFGVRAVVWDEGFASAAGDAAALRPDTVVMAWRGMEIAQQAALAGHDVIAAPVFPTYFDYYQERVPQEPVAIGGPVRLEDVAAFGPVPAGWPEQARANLIGAQFQVWTEYIPDARSLEYMIFPRACALAEVAWSGGSDAFVEGERGQPALRDRIGAHLHRLDAAGIEYRPLSGPRPWQQGGSGPRRHRPGYLVEDVAVHLGQLAAGEDL
jgi:hexosaminidase